MIGVLPFLNSMIAGDIQDMPVQIDSCSMVVSTRFERGVQLFFHNTSPQTITHVTFRIENGAHATDVDDEGNFPPGTEIDHILVTPTWSLQNGSTGTCSVNAVRFGDGTDWSIADPLDW